MTDPNQQQNKPATHVNFDTLTSGSRDQPYGSGYTRFVRIMRLVLPLIALGIIVILFSVKGVDDNMISPIQNSENPNRKIEEKITRNELLNPEFRSSDKKQQPYKITALRAIQGEKNKDLVMLEKPVGTMVLNNGNTVKMVSRTGAYRQDTERFFLEGDVFLQHEKGYSLQSAEAHIDLGKNYAWSDKDVLGVGPDIKIEAKGMQADGKTGHIVFSGPAKLTLEKGMKAFEKEDKKEDSE